MLAREDAEDIVPRFGWYELVELKRRDEVSPAEEPPTAIYVVAGSVN